MHRMASLYFLESLVAIPFTYILVCLVQYPCNPPRSSTSTNIYFKSSLYLECPYPSSLIQKNTHTYKNWIFRVHFKCHLHKASLNTFKTNEAVLPSFFLCCSFIHLLGKHIYLCFTATGKCFVFSRLKSQCISFMSLLLVMDPVFCHWG